MAQAKRRFRHGWPSVAVALAFAGFVLVLASIVPTAMGFRSVWCDGYAEAWMLADNRAGPGCVEMPPWWEYLVPGHDTRLVCLGLCPDGEDIFIDGGAAR